MTEEKSLKVTPETFDKIKKLSESEKRSNKTIMEIAIDKYYAKQGRVKNAK